MSSSCEPMYILAIGDLHLKKKQHYEPMLDGIYEIVKKHKPQKVVILGDTLHTHETLNMICLVNAIKFFERLAELAKVYVLIGNHDRPNNQDFLSDYHPFYAVNHPNIKIVSKPYLEESILYVPYVYVGRFDEAIQDFDLAAISLVFAHQEFKGAQLGCKTSLKGDEWHEKNPLVVSGHIHDFQKLPGIVYVGTPVQHTFGEAPGKCLLMIKNPCDSDNREFAKIKIPGIKPKKIFRMTYDSFSKIKQDPKICDVDVKFIIQLHEEEAKSIKLLPNYHYYNEHAKIDLKVIRKSNQERQELVNTKNETFLEIFTRLLSDDPDTLKIFEETIL